MENKALYHEVAIERQNGLGLLIVNLSLYCLPATRYNFIAQTSTCPTHQLAPGSSILGLSTKSLSLNKTCHQAALNIVSWLSHHVSKVTQFFNGSVAAVHFWILLGHKRARWSSLVSKKFS